MKNVHFILLAVTTMTSLTCSKKEYGINITFSNPHGTPVYYSGFYTLQSTGEQTAMTGHTPGQYLFVIKEGDIVSGQFYKDTISYDQNDTLKFQLLANAELIIDTLVTVLDTVEFFCYTE
jgi:hypothetical protein